MARLLRRLKYLLRRHRLARELADEIEYHRSLTRVRLEGEGVAPEDSEMASRRRMGNVALAQEDARAVWIGASIERLSQDLRYGARLLRRNPGFTCVAVATLALGIGANAAMFSVVNGVLFRPLPYQNPDRLVMIWAADPRRDIHEAGTSFPTFTDWRAQSRRFTDMAIWAQAAARLHGGSERERVSSAFVSANLFPVLGVEAALGRTFSTDEEQRRERVVVLSHAFWQRQSGSDPNVLNRSLEIDGETPGGLAEPIQFVRIVGVMPEGFFFPTKDVQFWRPATLLGVDGKPKLYERQWSDRYTDRWRVVARLEAGATTADAQLDLTSIGRRLAEAFPVPAGRTEFPGFGVEIVPVLQQLTGRNLRLALWVFLGAVGCVLLIACANVASLLLARGTSREREFAIRAALGAGRARIARQLVIESALLAIGGCVAGTAIAMAGVRVLAVSAPPGIPRLSEISVDGAVLGFTAAVSILSGLVFGLAPAWKVARAQHRAVLQDTGSTASGSLRLRHTRSVLVIGECALAVVLLAGAGLLVRSFVRLQAVAPGFNPAGVLLVRIDLPIPVSSTWRRQEWETFQEITDRIARLPGVTHSGLIQNFLIASNPRTPITVEGRLAGDGSLDRTGVNAEEVTPGFFPAMGVPLRQGRFFSSGEQNAPVALVNEAFALRFFPGEDPIGKRFNPGSPGTKMNWQTIIGVVGNIHRQGLEREPVPEFFIPSTEPAMDLAVRVTGNATSIAAAVRHEIRSAYGNAIVVRITTMDAFMGELSAERRYQTSLLGLFALGALALSAIGIYGLMQFAIAQRTREIGIRVALGANVGDVRRMVLREGLTLPLAGVALGVAGALALTRLLQHMLFEVTATDPLTFAGVASLLLGVTLIACYLPAHRASRVDPVIALRHD